MHDHDLEQDLPESKPRASGAHKFWFAVYQDVFNHELVGMHVQPPKAANSSRAAMFPFMVWVWMCGEAAHREREIIIKDQYISLVRGQLVLAERFLAEKANWTRKAARLFLFRLQRHGMVRLSTVARGGQMLLDFGNPKRVPPRGPSITIVTLCNYDVYQFGLRKQGTASGTARGPTGDRIPISKHLTIEQSNQSPLEIGTKKDQSSNFGADGTDLPASNNVVPIRQPKSKSMVMDAPGAEFKIPAGTRQKIEALGVDPDELLDRMYEQIDKGARIGSKSRYLVTSAINEAHERDGTPKDVLKAVLSGNRFSQHDAIVKASAAQANVMAEIEMRARINGTRRNGQSDLVRSLKK